jgi:hypothetical protein
MQKFKQNETTATYRRIYMFLASAADGYTGVTSLVGATVNLFRNGVAFGSQPTTPASLTHISVGHWYYEVPQTYLSDLGILTVTVQDTNIRPVVLMAEVVNYDWTVSTGATAQQVWEYGTRNLTGAVSVTGNVTVGGFASNAITSSAFAAGSITNTTIANNAIVLRLANDAIASNARFTTFDTFAGYPLLSTNTNHLAQVNANNHIAANVHQFQNNVITSNATDASFVNELVDAVWDELAAGHTIADSFGQLLDQLASAYTGITGQVTSTVTATYTTFSTNLTALDDTYDHQTIVFTSGNLLGQSVPVDTFTQTNGLITTEEPFTYEPQPGDTFTILPVHVHSKVKMADAFLSRLLDSSGSSNDVMNERTVRSALRAMRNKVIVDSGNISVYKEDDVTAAWEGSVSNITDVTVNPDGGS